MSRDTMTANQLRRCVDRAAELHNTPSDVLSNMPWRVEEILPVGWTQERLLGLCHASVVPEGLEPALVHYEDPDDLVSVASTQLVGALGPGAMVITLHTTVRRAADTGTVRHRKQRTGLVLAVGPGLDVLWSPWQREEEPT